MSTWKIILLHMHCLVSLSNPILLTIFKDFDALLYKLFQHTYCIVWTWPGPEELRVQLNWAIRSKICRGIAKGLAFLHEESKLKIIHRDIKTTNILLDKDFTAKISDFGFAKLHEGEKTHIITKIAGTTYIYLICYVLKIEVYNLIDQYFLTPLFGSYSGYMAPEYAMRGHLTSKADVYSFGVVLLEIVSGQNSSSYRPNDESVYLLDLVSAISIYNFFN